MISEEQAAKITINCNGNAIVSYGRVHFSEIVEMRVLIESSEKVCAGFGRVDFLLECLLSSSFNRHFKRFEHAFKLIFQITILEQFIGTGSHQDSVFLEFFRVLAIDGN